MERHTMMVDLEKSMRRVFRQIRYEINDLLQSEMTSSEFAILRLLSEGGGKKATELSKALGVSASHITAVTDTMIDKEYITRRRSPNDRRVVEIVLTEKGEEIFKKFGDKKLKYLTEKFEVISDEELQQLINALHRLDRFKE
ncbi:MarR family winged helix-turn-helix transcriptional regulator [Priestia endophytica]|jgi:DNA-binding MarR family transcriptional regulator|uniref:MarR family winged helix-turn-helix transcriptional regulator n=1 Tax=Priestia endophytica TaxID=135735 RepID=UPI000DCA4858|nr:MarR family transcriptional regulator [Priestia endophytica]MED4072385.1 MarR family transcriptional regulator [Priestia endophytica]RAS73954.1 MarR family transcriptional regulator [Priestia endophytica]RPK12694.1 hypothetical protein FH5_02900 [Priestia endophytica]